MDARSWCVREPRAVENHGHENSNLFKGVLRSPDAGVFQLGTQVVLCDEQAYAFRHIEVHWQTDGERSLIVRLKVPCLVTADEVDDDRGQSAEVSSADHLRVLENAGRADVLAICQEGSRVVWDSASK